MILRAYSGIWLLYTTSLCVLVQARDYYFDFCSSGRPETVTGHTTSTGANMTGSIRASSYSWWRGELNCNIVLIPPAGEGIVLHFENVNLYGGSKCWDAVTISEYSYGRWFELARKCNNSGEKDYLHDGPMRINFETSSSSRDSSKGFHISYTTYYDRPCWKSNSFYCPINDICISKSLTCDGINNCGDGSDESFAECKRTGTIIGCVVGGVIFLLVVAAITKIRRKHRLNERSRLLAAASTSSTATAPIPTTPMPYSQINSVFTLDEHGYPPQEAPPSYEYLQQQDPPKSQPDDEPLPPSYNNVQLGTPNYTQQQQRQQY